MITNIIINDDPLSYILSPTLPFSTILLLHPPERTCILSLYSIIIEMCTLVDTIEHSKNIEGGVKNSGKELNDVYKNAIRGLVNTMDDATTTASSNDGKKDVVIWEPKSEKGVRGGDTVERAIDRLRVKANVELDKLQQHSDQVRGRGEG